MADPIEAARSTHDDALWQAIREVPGMYLGDIWDGSGLHNTLDSAVALFIDAHIAGHCTRIDVTLRSDGSAEVRSDGLGALGDGKLILCNPRPEWRPSWRYPPARDPVFRYGRGAGSGRAIIPEAVPAVSEFFTADFSHQGERRRLSFHEGRLTETHPTALVGDPGDTVLRFRPDPLVFPEVAFDAERVASLLRELSFMLPGLTVTLCDERADGVRHSFCAPRGIADFLVHVVGDRGAVPVHPVVLAASHSDETGPLLRIEMAFCWVDSFFTDVRGYTNASYNRNGGTHVSSLRRFLPDCLRVYAQETHLVGAGGLAHFHPDAVREGLVAVVSVWHCQPDMLSSTGHKLCSSDVTPVARAMVTDQFEEWLWAHPDEARAIVAAVLERPPPPPAIG